VRRAGRRACVIGGSVAGLLAARVLADHFDEVLLFERDRFPDNVDNRKGVPQGRHAHALLCSGRRALEALFPKFVDELAARGALAVDINGLRWFDNGGYHARCTGIEALLVSRALLETHVRARVASLGVQMIDGCDVEGVLFTAGGARATGLRARRIEAAIDETFEADLIVDATGRGSQVPAWLESAGMPRPIEECVRVALGYSTRLFKWRPEHLAGDIAAIIPSAPPGCRGGAMMRLEGERWMVTLFGMLGDHPPTDPAGYLDFAKTLPAPDIYDTIKDAEPLTDAIPFKFPASSRRRYEQLERFPEGLLVFGDAICSFNPIYGQGMSVAARQALALRQSLMAGGSALAKRFFKAAAAVIDNPWTMAMGGDLRYESVEGPRSNFGNFINWYLGKVHIAARRDPSITFAFHSVANLLTDPPSLLHPRVALRVFKGNVGVAH
jgi:flavin-dependent dehydrogenase